MKKQFYLPILLFLLSSILYSGFSQDVYVLDPKYPVHDINNALSIYPDDKGDFEIEDIKDNPPRTIIKGSDEPIFLPLGPVYWGRVDLMATDSLNGWTLQFEDRKIGLPAWTKSNGKVDVYAFQNNKLLFHRKTGVEYPKGERDIQSNWVLNQVSLEGLPINQPVSLIIKAEGNQIGYSPYFNLSARSPEQPYYHQIYHFQNSFNLFMVGVTFIILIYHVLQYVYLKERVYLWFSIWMLFCTLTQFMAVGVFIGSITILRFSIWALIANGIFYTFWFFGRSFIGSKEKFPKLDMVMKGLALFLLIEILLVALYVAIFNPQTNQTGVGIHYMVLNIYTLASFVVSIILLTKKDLFAKYFGIGAL
ncbi:MAG: 7TM diverse intracellular signaling domain-containing protein, partial [Flavobacteriaceae bacterium]|nr:7TM diverse intracellular signaling domain-containing protein [Flavobacteriaceae bacterium]